MSGWASYSRKYSFLPPGKPQPPTLTLVEAISLKLFKLFQPFRSGLKTVKGQSPSRLPLYQTCRKKRFQRRFAHIADEMQSMVRHRLTGFLILPTDIPQKLCRFFLQAFEYLLHDLSLFHQGSKIINGAHLMASRSPPLPVVHAASGVFRPKPVAPR